MRAFGCNCRCNCSAAAVAASAVIGVIAAFLQITAVITVTPVFLWVIFGISVAYLAGLALTACRCQEADRCTCSALDTALVGILGTVLFSVVLLAVGITATSVVSAILVGLAVGFFALILSAAACLVRSLFGCD